MVAITTSKRRSQRITNVAKSLILLNMSYFLYYIVVAPSRQQPSSNCEDDQAQLFSPAIQSIGNLGKNVYSPDADIRADNRRHWCIIAPKFLPRNTREHFDHFPHTTEIILPCWSYFMEHGAWIEDRNAIQHEKSAQNCGFYIASEKLSVPSWSLKLIEAMGCEIKYGGQGPASETGLIEALPSKDIQYIPNLYLLRPRFNYRRYINHPDHAHALRRLFISDEDIEKSKTHRSNDGNISKLLQIGMIQRPASRRIGNFEDIKDALQEAMPNATITTTNFEFGTVKEQAEWFATKDVIIAAHGAAVVNSVFITPGTIVMQLYPPGYFWESLEPLIEQSGGHAIQWYKKGVNPIVESATMEKELFYAAGQGLEAFSPPVDEIVKPVIFSLGMETPTNKKLFNLYGHWV